MYRFSVMKCRFDFVGDTFIAPFPTGKIHFFSIPPLQKIYTFQSRTNFASDYFNSKMYDDLAPIEISFFKSTVFPEITSLPV